MNKNELFALYNKMYENPEQYSSEIRNMYFLTISLNEWWDEYYTQYPNEFGLQADSFLYSLVSAD